MRPRGRFVCVKIQDVPRLFRQVNALIGFHQRVCRLRARVAVIDRDAFHKRIVTDWMRRVAVDSQRDAAQGSGCDADEGIGFRPHRRNSFRAEVDRAARDAVRRNGGRRVDRKGAAADVRDRLAGRRERNAIQQVIAREGQSARHVVGCIISIFIVADGQRGRVKRGVAQRDPAHRIDRAARDAGLIQPRAVQQLDRVAAERADDQRTFARDVERTVVRHAVRAERHTGKIEGYAGADGDFAGVDRSGIVDCVGIVARDRDAAAGELVLTIGRDS